MKTQPLLKKAKYVMPKNSQNLTNKQKAKFMKINQTNLLTVKARKMKENFLQIFQTENQEQADAFFDSWYENVKKSNVGPMKKAAKTLKNGKQGIAAIVKHKITNTKAENFNGKIQRLNAIAHSYRNFDKLRGAILFHNGQLDILSHT